jgi:hypothetical protein
MSSSGDPDGKVNCEASWLAAAADAGANCNKTVANQTAIEAAVAAIEVLDIALGKGGDLERDTGQ